MLYNPQLDTFIQTSDAGSFNKAAEELFITPTAVAKQINLLENDIGVKLFKRTHSGIVLTSAGRSLYLSAKDIVRLCGEAANRARSVSKNYTDVIRIGTSPLTPADTFFRIWPQLYARCPDIKYQLIPYENSLKSAEKILGSLGTNIDVIAGIFDEELLKARKCSGLVLSHKPICAAVSITHRLSKRKKLSISDLYGENLLLIKHGWCLSTDIMRDEIKRKHSQIHVTDFDFYNVDVFNQCENNKAVLMAIDSWSNVHPLLRIIPVDWPYTIPYGLFHAPKPSAAVERFLDAVKEISKP